MLFVFSGVFSYGRLYHRMLIHDILQGREVNDRKTLYETWAQLKLMFYFQPYDLVRKYFGVKIGEYTCNFCSVPIAYERYPDEGNSMIIITINSN